MKKILSLVIALLFTTSLSSFAQGNLQFNQVLSESFVISPNSASNVLTVPNGKVWKIESIGSNNGGNANMPIQINGLNCGYVVSVNNYQLMNSIWLKAGDTFNLYNNSTGAFNGFYSIIEFNIVP